VRSTRKSICLLVLVSMNIYLYIFTAVYQNVHRWGHVVFFTVHRLTEHCSSQQYRITKHCSYPLATVRTVITVHNGCETVLGHRTVRYEQYIPGYTLYQGPVTVSQSSFPSPPSKKNRANARGTLLVIVYLARPNQKCTNTAIWLGWMSSCNARLDNVMFLLINQ
jgi:hypothetical protein